MPFRLSKKNKNHILVPTEPKKQFILNEFVMLYYVVSLRLDVCVFGRLIHTLAWKDALF